MGLTYILGMLDDKIDLNLMMNEALGAMGRAIFEAWLVEFLPERAKMKIPPQWSSSIAMTSMNSSIRAALEAQAGAEKRVNLVAEDILKHFEKKHHHSP